MPWVCLGQLSTKLFYSAPWVYTLSLLIHLTGCSGGLELWLSCGLGLWLFSNSCAPEVVTPVVHLDDLGEPQMPNFTQEESRVSEMSSPP